MPEVFSTHYEILSCFFPFLVVIMILRTEENAHWSIPFILCYLWVYAHDEFPEISFILLFNFSQKNSELPHMPSVQKSRPRSGNDNSGADIIFSFCCKDITGTSTYQKNAQTNGNENFKNTFHNINNSFLSLF